MKGLMKHIFIFFAFIFCTVFVNIAHSETLRVGISTDYAPVAFKDNGKIVGIEADLAQYVGDITGMTIQLIETPWENLEESLNQGKIDVIMSGVSITDERNKRVDFTQPYMTIGQMALIKADNIMSLSSKMAMYSAGKRFGSVNNTTGQKFVESEFTNSQMTVFNTVELGIKALKSDKIDYFIHDAPTIWQYSVIPRTQDKTLFGLYEYMTDEPLAWVVKKGNKALLDNLNIALSSMQSKGLVNKTINHWIPLKIEVGQ